MAIYGYDTGRTYEFIRHRIVHSMFQLLYDTVKWNCCSLLESILEIWESPLKNHVIKTIFLQWRNKFFAVRQKIPY